MSKWDPANWKSSLKVLLGIATIWPPIYIALFILIIASIMFMTAGGQTAGDAQDINLLQLDRKIRGGEIEELIITQDEVIATDRATGVRYRTSGLNDSERQEIFSAATQKDESGAPLVAKIEENSSSPVSPAIPFAFAGVFGAHMLTILLMLALMPFYIILAVKNERVDQTMRIVWVVLMCTATMFAAPVYWYLYIWRKPAPGLAR